MRPMIESQEGIILKKIPYGEADEILTVLLKHNGVRRFFVTGSRKSKKKYQGLIDQFSHLQFHYSSAKQGLWRLTSVDSADVISAKVWRDLNSYAFGNYLAELIYELVPEAEHNTDLYHVWLKLQQDLFLAKPPLLLAARALVQIFRITGYALELNACVSCEKTFYSEKVVEEIAEEMVLDVVRGGVMCGACEFPLTRKTSEKISCDLLRLIQSDSESAEKIANRDWNIFFKFVTLFAEQVLQKKSQAASFFLKMLPEK